jgi:citrate lyase subunit beta/citryl-CoA lyase
VLEALAALDAAGGKHLPIMVMIESPIAVLRAERSPPHPIASPAW